MRRIIVITASGNTGTLLALLWLVKKRSLHGAHLELYNESAKKPGGAPALISSINLLFGNVSEVKQRHSVAKSCKSESASKIVGYCNGQQWCKL